MVQLHLVSGDIGSDQPCTFHFQIEQGDGRYARLDLSVPRQVAPDGVTDVGGTFASARRELVTTLLHALIDANHLDEKLAPAGSQELPNSTTVVDLRRPANDHQALTTKLRRWLSTG